MSELPVNWWVQPSVIRTFSSRGDMRVGTSTAGSGMTFSPSQNGTSLDLQAGLEARVRENITLGVQAGYAHSVSGSSAEGYNGQAHTECDLLTEPSPLCGPGHHDRDPDRRNGSSTPHSLALTIT
ncbi:CP4-44 prophage; antigen 43 (Ag43)phase-variable biofilm formation autotransporter [Escherichia coli]|nr:CP4-44 prophage; antigen 43 (Ag43)phase-variable biofilm formation autotransporter [Escherichia coli]